MEFEDCPQIHSMAGPLTWFRRAALALFITFDPNGSVIRSLKAMCSFRRALILETDPEAIEQMDRVLKALDIVTLQAADEDSACQIASGLIREGTSPDLIIVRVTLAGSSGIQTLDRLAELFPNARHIVTSHYSKEVLFRVPGFAEYAPDFLAEVFTDDEFRQAVQVRLTPKAIGWVDRR